MFIHSLLTWHWIRIFSRNIKVIKNSMVFILSIPYPHIADTTLISWQK